MIPEVSSALEFISIKDVKPNSSGSSGKVTCLTRRGRAAEWHQNRRFDVTRHLMPAQRKKVSDKGLTDDSEGAGADSQKEDGHQRATPAHGRRAFLCCHTMFYYNSERHLISTQAA